MAKNMKALTKEADVVGKEKGPIAVVEHIMKGTRELSKKPIERARKGARRKAWWFNLLASFTQHTVSEEFFLPKTVDIGEGTHSILRTGGIERPYVSDIITHNTYRLYQHESGLVGLVETDGGARSIFRIPLRAIDTIGLDRLEEDMPHIRKGLRFENSGFPAGVYTYIDGDLVYTTEYGADKDSKEKDAILRELRALSEREAQCVRADVRRVAGMTSESFPRSSRFSHDYYSGEDLKKRAAEYDHTPLGIIMGEQIFVVFAVFGENGILGRVYGKHFARVCAEERIPFRLLKTLRKQGVKTDIERVDLFMENDTDFNYMRNRYEVDGVEHIIELDGDLVYACDARSRKAAYRRVREMVDRLGKRCNEMNYKMLSVF